MVSWKPKLQPSFRNLWGQSHCCTCIFKVSAFFYLTGPRLSSCHPPLIWRWRFLTYIKTVNCILCIACNENVFYFDILLMHQIVQLVCFISMPDLYVFQLLKYHIWQTCFFKDTTCIKVLATCFKMHYSSHCFIRRNKHGWHLESKSRYLISFWWWYPLMQFRQRGKLELQIDVYCLPVCIFSTNPVIPTLSLCQGL